MEIFVRCFKGAYRLFALFFLLILLLPYAGFTADISSYGAVVILDKVNDTFDKEGREVWEEEREVQVSDQRGIKEFGEVAIPFSTKHQKLKILYAYTELPDGSKIKPSKEAFNLVSPPFVAQAPIYSDLKYRTISMPALMPGAKIHYAFRLKTVKPYMKGEFWSENLFQCHYPVHKAIYKLNVPAYKTPNILARRVMAKPKIEEKRGRKIYTWVLSDVAPVEQEPSSPPLDEEAKEVKVSTVKSWEGVAKWYWDLAKDALEPDEMIKEEVYRITRGIEEKVGKIKAIYNYVATNIRYVGLEFGINGYKPHPASQTFQVRYGDCKDHATLIIAMLKAIEIEAYPVLIPTRNVADLEPQLPTPGAFNHEIAAIKTKDGYLFMDTTSEVTPFGELPPDDQGRGVLIVTGGGGVVTRTPVAPFAENREIYSGEFTLSSTGSLEGKAEFSFTGVYAMSKRYEFLHSTPQERRREVESTANALSPGCHIGYMEISDYRDLARKEVGFAFTMRDEIYATPTQHFLLFHPPFKGYKHLADLVASEKRSYDFVIGYQMEKDSKLVLHLPPGYEVLFIPEDYNFLNEVGVYQIRWRRDKDTIRGEVRLILKKEVVPVDLYKQMRALFNLAVKTEKSQVVILKKVK